MAVHESDICIIGGGITSAMLAERLSELRPGLRIIVVEAGRSIFDAQNRGRYRDRAMQYGYSTSHGVGAGLPGAKRLMDEFNVDSVVGQGTTITMTKWRRAI